jgi:hypothetical protein
MILMEVWSGIMAGFSPKIFQRGNMELVLQLVKEHN